MIDVHSHLLPGVDDGSPSLEISRPVLERFAADGVECLVLTPHLQASQAGSAPRHHHEQLLAEVRAVTPPALELRLGWEIMLDVPNADLRAPHLALGGSRALLVEFPRMSVPAGAATELFRLRSAGAVPVLAHPERYWGCTVAQVTAWRNAGAVIQMDTTGLASRGAMGTLARALLDAGLVDLFASDNHGDSRSLATARAWLLECATPEHAELLTHTNAGRVLADQPPVPVPPLPRAPGMFERLRTLFLRR